MGQHHQEEIEGRQVEEARGLVIMIWHNKRPQNIGGTSELKKLTGARKANLGLGRENCQHAVIDEFLCLVSGCALGTDISHWMF